MTITDLTHLIDPGHAPRVVLKVGSSLLVGPDGLARRDWLTAFAAEIAEMRQRGQQVVVVSSGAIALGGAELDPSRDPRRTLAAAQASAAVGQIALASLWSDKLAGHGLAAGQMLVTLDDLEDRRRYLNASATLEHLLEAGVVPIVNENDSVATEEIRFGDNDRLAARVAQAAGADAVVLLSDVDGLFDRDPHEEGAQLLRQVDGIDAEILAMAKAGSSSGMGSGGMASKLQAAQIAERAGIALAIVNGTQERPIARATGEGIGTLFLPQRKDGARKAWLGGRLAPSGTLRVDPGCEAALRDGASLLAAGVVGVSGRFERGDLVRIDAMKGGTIAQGLAEYSAHECQAIAGLREEQQAERLGYAPRSAVVHRDHLVIL
ncbi:glutamate 5-kinase [Erythrobacter sp. HKB08]|uniref:glutamate 5-kinase n=1 Tax=Erythrobacter sp. HKB08 TaxID=2502843 RepID=UPI001008AECF|nr:glutamate 5-kinase [Erythrobacter sp. HKB08]